MPALTVEMIRRLKPGSARVERTDSAARGLQLHVEPSGVKRFVLRYAHTADGVTTNRKFVLGFFGDGAHELKLDAARALAATWRGRMKHGEFPHLEAESARHAAKTARNERAAAPTVANLIELFLEKYLAVNCRKPDARLVTARKWLLDPEDGIGTMLLVDVRRKDLNAVLDRMVAAGKPVAAYSLGRLLGQMFRFAVDEEMIDSSPAERLKKGKMHTERKRALDDNELKQLWHRLDDATLSMSNAIRIALRILVTTGVRCGDIAKAEWVDVKLHGKEPLWTIHNVKDRDEGRNHLVPLSPLAIEQFLALKALTGDTPYCLPAAERVRGAKRIVQRETVPGTHMDAHAISVAVRRCQDAIGLKQFIAHDLRRTLRTGLSRLAIDASVAEAVIGHKLTNALIRTYDVYDRLPERRSALIAWGSHLQGVIGVMQ